MPCLRCRVLAGAEDVFRPHDKETATDMLPKQGEVPNADISCSADKRKSDCFGGCDPCRSRVFRARQHRRRAFGRGRGRVRGRNQHPGRLERALITAHPCHLSNPKAQMARIQQPQGSSLSRQESSNLKVQSLSRQESSNLKVQSAKVQGLPRHTQGIFKAQKAQKSKVPSSLTAFWENP